MKFPCPSCDKEIANKNALVMHLINSHDLKKSEAKKAVEGIEGVKAVEKEETSPRIKEGISREVRRETANPRVEEPDEDEDEGDTDEDSEGGEGDEFDEFFD